MILIHDFATWFPPFDSIFINDNKHFQLRPLFESLQSRKFSLGSSKITRAFLSQAPGRPFVNQKKQSMCSLFGFAIRPKNTRKIFVTITDIYTNWKQVLVNTAGLKSLFIKLYNPATLLQWNEKEGKRMKNMTYLWVFFISDFFSVSLLNSYCCGT